MNWKKFSTSLIMFFFFLFTFGVSGCMFSIFFILLTQPYTIVVEPRMGILIQELTITGYVLLISFILAFYQGYVLLQLFLKHINKLK